MKIHFNVSLCVFPFSQAGWSRSATILTAYLMKKYQLGFTEAYNRLKSVKQL